MYNSKGRQPLRQLLSCLTNMLGMGSASKSRTQIMNKVVSETLQSTFLYGHPGDKLQWFTSDCSLESITSVNLFLPGEAAATGCNFQTPYPGDGFASLPGGLAAFQLPFSSKIRLKT